MDSNLIVGCGKSVKLMQEGGETALMLAASRGHVDTVNALLAKGADMETTSEVMAITKNDKCLVLGFHFKTAFLLIRP